MDSQQIEEDKKVDQARAAESNAVAVTEYQKAPVAPALPVFWDGTPGTLQIGMVCREGKESATVQAIIPCINGTIIFGVVSVNGQPHNINVTQPRRHPLADVADESERRKFWEYDQL